jgi:hypothetical protein
MGDRLYNFITASALLLTVVVIVGVAVLLLSPAPQEDFTALLPTAAFVPTATPITPTATFTATRTPLPATFTLPPTETLTPPPSSTPTASVTPTATITDTPAPTFTPSITFTPSASPTLPPTATPTGPTNTPVPTVNPFPFDLRETVLFQANFANTFGCAWQGVGGTVTDLNGAQFPSGSLQVRVFDGAGLDRVIGIGSNSLYGGPSGYELKVADGINNQLYFVQLESTIGVQQSPVIQIQFPSNCTQNVALVNFVQKRSLQQPPAP